MTSSGNRLEEPQLKELRELLDVCDDLRKIFGSISNTSKGQSLTIPEVVVVGNQSVGKSSLLELLSGFRLPSGTGIVTRCPIVLQIRRGPRERYEIEGQQVKFNDFGTVLHSAQARLVSQECKEGMPEGELGVDVTAQSVCTRIEGPRNRDITLVDLPGIQYSNNKLTGKIKDIIHEYIKNPAAIILLVSQCSSDPTATEALQCAREVDEDQQRTVCILTKPDELRIDDEAKMTSLIELVEGKHQSLNFPRGVFMTKSRSGADDEKSIEDVRKMETEFFQSHPYFNHCLKNLKHAGYENLMNTIEQLSLKSIKSSLPKMRDEVSRELENKELELQAIDQSQIVDDPNVRCIILTSLFSKVIASFQRSYESRYGRSISESLEKFEIKLLSITKESTERLDDNLSGYLNNRDPLRPAGVINQWLLDSYCSEFIRKLLPPSEELLEEIYRVMCKAVFECIETEIQRRSVREAVQAATESILRQMKREVVGKLKESFDLEDLYYFSQLTRFFGPTVHMLYSLDDNFTFSNQVSPVQLSNFENFQPALPNKSDTLSASNLNLVRFRTQTEDLEKKKKKKLAPALSLSKSKDIASNSSPDSSNETVARKTPALSGIDGSPGLNKATLRNFVEASKANPQCNARFVLEADTLVKEQETLHLTLQMHHFYTAIRVSGNVSKLMLYFFRKKISHELHQKLDSVVGDLSDSLTPDPALNKQLRDIKKDIAQLEEAKQKIKTAMRASYI